MTTGAGDICGTTMNGHLCSCGVFVYPGHAHVCRTYYSNTYDFTAHQKLDEILRLIKERVQRTCSICGNDSPCWMDMPFGSTHDGEVICGDCCNRYIDPILDLIATAKSQKDTEANQCQPSR